ncbi:MAG TPA: hypothetical protein DEP48_06115 [Persephonella sp.]|uniref:Uncharacterized protein n=1 Tax=Persephonella marina (strain DSM 14350 / EX-H1) TaxID=123214 RepID=C0QP70_PERMH|nr:MULTISPECIES: hypothetical protein [Persephonella]ACO04474.1 hypothetical protein PERMA_0678 [Persephonella marina EX-H1]HCB69918.1 hypothetical protein [Persephonella sp.]
MRKETPYAYDFLWKQIEKGFYEVRKKRYRDLLERFLKDPEIRKKFEEKKDRKGRDYRGGMLEKTASVLSLALCMYDNYPEIDIDLLLTAILMNGFCSVYTKRECYEKIKDYPEIIPFLFKKKRIKPDLEITIFENLYKFDDKIYKQLKKKRGEDGT